EVRSCRRSARGGTVDPVPRPDVEGRRGLPRARHGDLRMTRFDPDGKRALFETPVTAPPEQLQPGRPREGRDAVFSVGPPEPGTVVVDCSSCHGRARVPITDLGVRLLTG